MWGYKLFITFSKQKLPSEKLIVNEDVRSQNVQLNQRIALSPATRYSTYKPWSLKMRRCMDKYHPTTLIILDGFGYTTETKYNAIAHANTPYLDHYFANYPSTIVQAAGTAVGLLPNAIGNSEVGHLTIGAGRIIKQSVTIMHEAIDTGTFFTNQKLVHSLEQLKKTKKILHIMGLLSDAGVHAHEKHIYAFIKAAADYGITNIIIHAFLDGRDTPPQSAKVYLQHLDATLKIIGHGKIGSLHGRFYAMDRDHNWKRTETSYRVLTESQSTRANNWQEMLKNNYAKNITDEFISPIQVNPDSLIKNGDGVIFCNFRPDRAQQLTTALIDKNFDHFKTKLLDLAFFITPTKYNTHLPTTVLFPSSPIPNTLKDVLAQHQKTIFSIAETEKYAHITYFFNGGRQDAAETETRVLIPSLPVKNYVDHPEMLAQEITKTVITSLQTAAKDFYLINYANADMVGHSGNFGATIKAIEILDEQLGQLYEQIITKMNGTLYITADHGNAEDMFDTKTGQPRTAHTNNSVPFIMIRQGLEQADTQLSLNKLSDIAPFILQNMGLPTPKEMK